MIEKRNRNLKITNLRKEKLTLSEIAEKYEISVPRVWIIVRNTRKKLRQEKQLKNQNRA